MMLRVGVIMYQTSQTKGQELVAQRMVAEFRRQGYDAFLITSVFHDSELVVLTDDVVGRGGYVQFFDERLGIPVIRVNSEAATWPPRRTALRDFTAILGRIVGELKLNVLITHSTLWNGPEEVLKFIQWKRKMAEKGSPDGVPLFLHMSHFQEANEERYLLSERSFREAWNNVSLTQIVKECDLVLVTTPIERELMVGFGAEKGKCFLFPGGIDEDLLDSYARPNEFREKFHLPNRAKLVSFLGSVEERKNVLTILEIARLLSDKSDIHFVIAGRLEGSYGEKVQTESSSLKTVSVLGPLSKEERGELIATSFVNINMSRAEALGLSQMEFMSAEVPVITSGVGGQSWVVKNNSTGIIVNGPDDVKGAADAISRLADHTSARNRLGRAAAHSSPGFMMSGLVHHLSKRLEDTLKKRTDQVRAALGTPSHERTVEVWVKKGYRVIATDTRLIISSTKRTKQVVLVPYNEMTKIVSHVKASIRVLLIGLAATILLLAARAAELTPYSPMVALLNSLTDFVRLPHLPNILISLLPFLPLAISLAIFGLSIEGGYLMLYGASRRVYLPKEFSKALRFVDTMTPQNLFGDEA
ncbi:MAG: glycosyltransferase family 4 protein [Thaumarchaeota archaeon]|nr:glycosyltransferase family 4 protein [Nitrososphaerota archaeon]